MDFILEQEKNVLNTFWRTSTFFDESDELFELEEFSGRHRFTRFLCKVTVSTGKQRPIKHSDAGKKQGYL